MPRKTRVEYEGACYHGINRGNYRAWMFGDDKTREPFERCLGEAVERMGWVVHGWVVMGIHFLWRPLLPDPKDDLVLELAVASRSEYVVTHNVGDFRPSLAFNVKAVRPADFLLNL